VSEPSTARRRVAPWRIAAAIAVLGGLAWFGALFAPIYFHNMELQNYVASVARDPANLARPDDLLRARILEKADRLELPVKADNIRIERAADALRVEVRYFVRVDLPGYTVDLHFYPGAGSR
jgi:hypothetical protein